MPRHCCFPSCKNNNCKDSSLHGFPLDNPEQLAQWLLNIGRKDFVPTAYSRLCGNHFAESDFYPMTGKANGRRKLKPDVVPSIFSSSEPAQGRLEANTPSLLPTSEPTQGRLEADTPSLLPTSQPNECASTATESARKSYKDLLEENERLRFEVRQQSKNMECLYMKLAAKKFRCDKLPPDSIKALTGYDYNTFNMLFDFFDLQSSLKVHVLSALLPRDQFLLTLTKLRQGVAGNFLAVIFEISQPTVNIMFNATIQVLYKKSIAVNRYSEPVIYPKVASLIQKIHHFHTVTATHK